MSKKAFGIMFSSALMFSSLADTALIPGDLVWKVNTTVPVVALSFDDGPGPYTEKVLDMLKTHNAKATFFMLGELVKTQPQIAQSIVKAGHEPASHTYTHTNFAKTPPETGTPKLTDSIRKTQDVIEQAVGQRPRYVRMPHGIDRPWIREVAKEQGLVLVNWTFGYDWFNMTREVMAKSYVDQIRPGAIILMHDGGKRQKTVDVLEILLQALNEKGYQVVSVGELLEKYPSTAVPSKKQAKAAVH
jgi:peptidoglycan-N-acetylglucosamine deacetylase